MNTIKKLANAQGFRGIYLLKPAPYPRYAERQAEGTIHKNGAALCADPQQEHPWMNALLMLLMPYQPYPESAGVSGYYTASNRSYHAGNRLVKELNAFGIRAARISVPVRETLLRHGIGIACRNGLTAVEPFGTRFIAQTLALNVPKELLKECLESTYELNIRTCPPDCNRCMQSCPSYAIKNDGMQYDLCVRADMEGGVMRKKTMEHMTAMLGCEICQYVCPLNSKIDPLSEVPDAFDLHRLLSGDNKPALELIGKNMNSGGRLQQHALMMAAKRDRIDLLPKIEQYLHDPRPQIVQAAEYAISLLHNMAE